MRHLYGSFSEEQLQEYKTKLHKDLYLLILYKDPKTKGEFESVDFNVYFTFLMKKINGLNSLLFYPTPIVEMMSLLQAAYLETQSENYKWRSFRKLIFDAQSEVDKIGENYDKQSNV